MRIEAKIKAEIEVEIKAVDFGLPIFLWTRR